LNYLEAIFYAALIVILTFFIVKFISRSFKLIKKLDQSIKNLRTLKREGIGNINGVHNSIRKLFTTNSGGIDKMFSIAWEKYEKSLQFSESEADDGQIHVEGILATASADLYFSEQVVVDNYLKTELFKQFPAILTGIGICATFAGLIIGLRDFDTTAVTSENVQKNLGDLFSVVSHAFTLSGIAIFIALVITIFEKSIIAKLYVRLDELHELLDGFFGRWSGEAYLEKLHANSDKSTTQLAQMKDAVIADLKDVLITLSKEQIKAYDDRSQQMVQNIQYAIAQGLEKPMDAIAEAVKGVSQHQGQAVDKLLTDVLVQFSSKVEGLFGGQMQGMAELMQRASERMQDAVTQFSGFAEKMNDSGIKAVDAMANKLQQSLSVMDSRQETMNLQTQQFFEQFKIGMQQAQYEHAHQFKHVLVNVEEQLSSIMEHMGARVGQMVEQQAVRQNELEQATKSAVDAMIDQISRLMAQSVETSHVLNSASSSFLQATDAVVAGLHVGAENIRRVFGEFERAGQGITEATKVAIEGTGILGGAMERVSHLMNNCEKMIIQFCDAQKFFSSALDELKRTIDVAKRDTSIASEIIQKIEFAATMLIKSKEEAGMYLDKVSAVLIHAHSDFQRNVSESLGKATSGFQEHLELAVNKLSGTIKSLEEALEDAEPIIKQESYRRNK
jgi:hypothetical protein